MKSGRTALHEAAKEGHAEVCRYLLKQGAHVNATDNVSGSQIVDCNRLPLSSIVIIVKCELDLNVR